jgi:O-antigen biosynthesis protein
MGKNVLWHIVMKYQHYSDFVIPLCTKSRRIFYRGLKGYKKLIDEDPHSIWQSHEKMCKDRDELYTYKLWYMKNEPSGIELEGQKELADEFEYRPLISIITPVYNTPLFVLEETIKSVINQTYDNWEMCLVDGKSKDENIRKTLNRLAQGDRRIKIKYLNQNFGISGNSNEALKLANGDFIALLDHNDMLAPFALFDVVEVLNKNRNLDFIYSDRDLVTKDGAHRYKPSFKPDWSPDIMLSANYLTHISVIRKNLVDGIGGFAPEMDGAQDWDLFLKITENTDKIFHIPKILYHCRDLESSCWTNGANAKPYIFKVQCAAIQNHLSRIGLLGTVIFNSTTGCLKIRWQIKKNYKVSIIIPTRDNKEMLKCCVDSIFIKSTYKNYELILIDTGSIRSETFKYYEDISKNENVRIINYDMPFNYSRVNNTAAKHASGEILLFLNDDTEVISPGWIEELLGWVEQEDIGAVGAKLLKPDKRIQHAGVIIGLQGFAGHLFAGAVEDHMGIFGSCEWYRNYLAVTGACIMIRRALFEKIKGFNETFELNGSDVELCLRLRNSGYRIVYTPFAKLIHYEGATREKYIKHIPQIDFETSYNYYKPYIDGGDPYYNVNLSLWSTIPCIKSPDEKDVADFVDEVRRNGID